MTDKKDNQIVEAQNAPVALNETGAIMAAITKASSDPNTDVVKLEKMFELYERVCDKQARQAFTSALARMQSDMPTVIERNQSHNSSYASMEDITDTVRPVLQKHGFAVTFRINQADSLISIVAVLSHEGGHSEETSMSLPADDSGKKNAVQAMGSTVSYGKRYTMCALLNITTRGEDDDGGASDPKVTADQAEIIKEKLMKCSTETRDKFMENFSAVTDVPKSAFDGVIATMNRDINKQEAASGGDNA